MIAALITSCIDLVLPIINIFIKNAEKNKDMKEKMFKMIENHSTKIQENVNARRDYESLRLLAEQNRKNENGI